MIDFDNTTDANAEALENAKKIIDQALIDCADNAGVLGSLAFQAAIKTISADTALWLNTDVRLKQQNPLAY